MNRQEWVSETYRLLVQTQGPVENENEEANLRGLAAAMADEYFDEGITSKEAVEEELSASV